MTEPVVRHSLKNRDEKTLTAECSVCGFVAIRKSGTGFQCANKIAQSHRAWAKANPEKAKANRRVRSKHELVGHDYVALTAWCSECKATVDIVIWGSGYACGVNARRLRSVQQSTTSGGHCRECAIIDGPASAPRLRADGSCPRCSDPRLLDTGAALKDGEHHHRHSDDDRVPDGVHIVHESDDAYAMPEDESVVYGWTRSSGKVLGSSRPWNEV